MSLANVLSPISNFGGSDKGPTADQNNLLASKESFMNTLQQDFGTAFAGQQNIINGLTKSLTNTLQAGPSQYGFNAQETADLNTLATNANAQAYRNARAAAGEAAAATGQGGSQLPSGSQGEEQANLALKSAEAQSNSILGIREAGYKQGSENYKEAVSGLTSAASLENPAALAGQANNAGESASADANNIQKIKAANNPWGQIGGLVGSLGGAALNMFVPGAGSALTAATSALGGVKALGAAGNTQLGTDLGSGVSQDFSTDNYQIG